MRPRALLCLPLGGEDGPGVACWRALGVAGLTLGDLRFIILSLSAVPQITRCPRMGLRLSPGLIFGATCIIFRTGSVLGASGVCRGPRGPKHDRKAQGRIYVFIFPKVRHGGL